MAEDDASARTGVDSPDHVAVTRGTESASRWHRARWGMPLGAMTVSVFALGMAGYAWYQTEVRARLSAIEHDYRISTLESHLQQIADTRSGIDSQMEQVQQQAVEMQLQMESLLDQLQQQADSESDFSARLQVLHADIETVASRVENRLDAWETDFREEFDNLSVSVRVLNEELHGSVEYWTLKEVEYLLFLANQRARSVGDVLGALRALQVATQQLDGLETEDYHAVTEAIHQEIALLENLPWPDHAMMSRRIADLSRTLEGLPMRGVWVVHGPSALPEKTDEDQSSGDAATAMDRMLDVGRKFLSDLGDLIQVEKDGEPVIPPLSPEIRLLIEDRGKLLLAGAQAALMQRDQDAFHERLQVVADWVRERYDNDHPGTVDWMRKLLALQALDVRTDIPDISRSLDILRGLMPDRSG